MTVSLHVCTTCRAGELEVEGTPRPGARLHAALVAAAALERFPRRLGQAERDPTSTAFVENVGSRPVALTQPTDPDAAAAPDAVEIKQVECLSACSQGCSVALSAPGRWSYVYGRLSENDAFDILSGAAAYARAPDGIVPWRERPLIFRKQSLARIPPVGD